MLAWTHCCWQRKEVTPSSAFVSAAFLCDFSVFNTRTIFFHCVSYSKSFSVLSVYKTSIYKIYCIEQFIKGNIPSPSYLVGIPSKHSSTVYVTRSSSVGKRGQFHTLFFTAWVIFLLKDLSVDSFWWYFSWTSWYILQDFTKDSQQWFPKSPKLVRSQCNGLLKKTSARSQCRNTGTVEEHILQDLQ